MASYSTSEEPAFRQGSETKVRGHAARLIVIWTCVLIIICSLASGAMAAKKKIIVWTTGPIYQKMFGLLLPEFEKEFPDIELDIQFGMGAADKLAVAYAGGAAPDIVTQSTRIAPQFIETGVFLPLNLKALGLDSLTELERRYLPGVLNSLRYKGQYYFLPTEVTSMGLFYDKVKVANAGIGEIPRTWEQLIETGRRLTKYEGTLATQAGVFIHRGGVWNALHWTAMLRQKGIDWITDDGKANFNHPKAIEALNAYSAFWETGAALPTGFDFEKGLSAFFPSASYYAFYFPPEMEVGASMYPVFEGGKTVSTSYSWGLYVTSQSKDPETAWKVAQFFTDARFSELWFNEGQLLQPYNVKWLHDTMRQQPILAPFINSLEYAQMEIAHPKYNDIQTQLKTTENAIISRQLSVNAALEQLNHQVNVILTSK
jgi:multiple sugar transport system substrate-binding protein